MNSLYTLGVRQTSSIQADLERMRGGDSSASLLGWLLSNCLHPRYVQVCTPLTLLLGQVSASLSAMNRTIDDYDSMARREMIKAKQEKAVVYVRLSLEARGKLT